MKKINNNNLNYIEFMKKIFDNTTDGYISFVQFKNKGIRKVYNTLNKNILDTIQNKVLSNNYFDNTNIFFTPNTFFIPKRSSNTVRQFRCLYVDLDDHFNDKGIENKNEVIFQIYDDLINNHIIPEPTAIIDSGRGLHLYWKVKDAPYGALKTWSKLEEFLCKKLKPYGSDKAATDPARLLRLPDTINYKSSDKVFPCSVLTLNDNIYDMIDLRKNLLHYTYKKFVKKQTKSKKTNNLFKMYVNRISDLELLCRMRSFDMIGYRNTIIHYYGYLQYLINDETTATNNIDNFNQLYFNTPLKDSEINCISTCCKNIAKKHIKDSESGYNYKSETLIDILEISDSEQINLKSIISNELKTKRRNEKQRKQRRDKNGLTKKDKNKINKIKQIKFLMKKGLSNKYILKIINFSKTLFYRYIKLINIIKTNVSNHITYIKVIHMNTLTLITNIYNTKQSTNHTKLLTILN